MMEGFNIGAILGMLACFMMMAYGVVDLSMEIYKNFRKEKTDVPEEITIKECGICQNHDCSCPAMYV